MQFGHFKCYPVFIEIFKNALPTKYPEKVVKAASKLCQCEEIIIKN